MLVFANLVDLLFGKAHLAQFRQGLPGLMPAKLSVHHRLGLLLDQKLFWCNWFDDDLACVSCDTDGARDQSNAVSLAVD